MDLVDVHCHIDHEKFKGKIDKVIERAKKACVKHILVSGVNPPHNRQVLELAETYPGIIKASLGIYPIDALGLQPDEAGLPHHEGKIDLEEQFAFFKKNQRKITAIGEVGMDFHWVSKETTYVQQADNFRKIIRFADKLKKPLVIHSRKAEAECLEILQEENPKVPVVLHCFSGKKSLIRLAAELDYYFSIPPNIVKASNFQTLVGIVDLKQLLTETDSPWLSPFSGKDNEPAYVLESVKKIAEIKEMEVEKVAEQIWKNYKKVF